MDKTTMIKVLNRDNGSVVYSLQEMNGLRRVYQPGETKEVTFEELEKLSYIPGGMELLKDNLVILNNDEAVKALLGDTELEYSYTKDDVLNLLKKGTLEEFLDCLDFAPGGVLDLIKTYAVSLPLNDVSKRDAIKEKLGFDVDNAIRIQKETEEPIQKEDQVKERRVKKTQTSSTQPTRRVTIPKK